MTDTARPKRRNKPTVRVKVHALPDGHPLKPKPKPKPPRKAPKPKPEGLEEYSSASIDDTNSLNDTARKLVAAMVWEGLPRDAAIKSVGISKYYAYSLLRREATKAHYRAELEVLRTSQHARVFHRLGDIVESEDDLKAAVAAAKILVGETGKQQAVPTVNVNITPGYVIDPSRAYAKQQPTKLIEDAEIIVAAQDDSLASIADNSQIASQALTAPAPPAPGAGHPVRRPVIGEPSTTGGEGPRFWRASQNAVGGKNGS